MRTKLFFILLLPLFVFGQANNSIKAYWRLDGNSNDVSGNAHTGTDANITYSLMNGKFNQGAGFNATSSKITTSANIGISGNAAFTISFWVYFTAITNHAEVILEWGAPSSIDQTDCLIWATFQHYGDLVFTIRNGYNTYTTSSVFTANNIWYYVVFTKSAGGMSTTATIYINAVSEPLSYNNGTGVPNITNSTVTIGYSNSYSLNTYLGGALDELIIDNTNWSNAKVSWMYNQYLGTVDVPDFLRPIYFLYDV
jgi:hypothetical protein